MKSAKIGLPIHQLLRNADPGTDPSTPTASTLGQGGASKRILKIGNTQLHAVSGPDVVPRFGGNTGSAVSSDTESDARPLAASLEPRGWLARTAVSFFFMSIVFLTGIFIGGSLTPQLPTPPPPAGVVSPPIPPRIETPTPDSSTTAYSSPEAATSEPGPAEISTAEKAPPSSGSAIALAAGAAAAPNPMPAPGPVSEEPAVVVNAPPAPAEPIPGPPIRSEPVASAPAPIAPAPVPATISAQPTLSDIQRQALLSRGDAFFSTGDITSARLFYQRGADAGDGTAALRLGETFDAAFLERAHLGRVPSDREKAVYWYRQARDLGSGEAEILLKSLRAN